MLIVNQHVDPVCSHVFWFGCAAEAGAIPAPSTISLWILWIGHYYWQQQCAHITECLQHWKGSYNTDNSQRGDRDHHLVRQNVWETSLDEDGTLVSEGPASYLLGDAILPEGDANTNAKANERMFDETGVPVKRQRRMTVDNCATAAAEFVWTANRHEDPEHFDHTGCDPHRLQLVLKALAHGTNGKKGDMHSRHVEQLVYKVIRPSPACSELGVVSRSGTCSRRTPLQRGST